MTRHGLDASKLSDFAPRRRDPEPERAGGSDAADGWASRESARVPQQTQKPIEGQFNIRASIETIERFKRMCKDDRRTYADMLGILMDAFEQR